MSLTNVWVQTAADGLVRADQIVGVDAHSTPAVAGKASRWLVDAVLAAPVGAGIRDRWDVTVLHRTLAQTGSEPHGAPVALARLLAQLDLVSAAGVITVSADAAADDSPAAEEKAAEENAREASTGALRFRFAPFALPEPGRHTDSEYL